MNPNPEANPFPGPIWLWIIIITFLLPLIVIGLVYWLFEEFTMYIIRKDKLTFWNKLEGMILLPLVPFVLIELLWKKLSERSSE